MKYPLLLITTLLLTGSIAAADKSTDAAQKAATLQTANVSPGQVVDLAEVRRLMEEKDYRGAVVQLKQLTKLDENNPELWQLLGASAHKKGDYLGSKVAFEKSVALDPDNVKTLALQAELFLSIGDKGLARFNLDKLKELCTDGCEPLDRISVALDGY